MPRPSLKDQRRREILDAFVASAARYGLEGATQERIAEIAGVKRTLLRHYLGNRGEMVDALTAHVTEALAAFNRELDAALARCATPMAIAELLLEPGSPTDQELLLVFQALTASAQSRPERRAPLCAGLEDLIAVIAAHLARTAPDSAAPICAAIAHGLAALALTADSLAPLDPPMSWRAAERRAAATLIASLETSAT